MSELTLTAWRPRRSGDAEALPTLLREYASMLKIMGAVTDREPLVLRAPGDDCLLLVEWKSPQAQRRADDNPSVNDALARLEEVAERVPLAEIEGADGTDVTVELA